MFKEHHSPELSQIPLQQLERALQVAAQLLVHHGAAYATTFRRLEAAVELARRDDPLLRAQLLLQRRDEAA